MKTSLLLPKALAVMCKRKSPRQFDCRSVACEKKKKKVKIRNSKHSQQDAKKEEEKINESKDFMLCWKLALKKQKKNQNKNKGLRALSFTKHLSIDKFYFLVFKKNKPQILCWCGCAEFSVRCEAMVHGCAQIPCRPCTNFEKKNGKEKL